MKTEQVKMSDVDDLYYVPVDDSTRQPRIVIDQDHLSRGLWSLHLSSYQSCQPSGVFGVPDRAQ